MTDSQQIEACKRSLKNVPINQWNMYENSIIAANSFIQSNDALKSVIEEIQRVFSYNDINDLSADQRNRFNIFYEDALKNIQKQTVIQRYDWQ